MSKGPGRVERAVAAAFAAEPDNAFTVEDLINRAYPGAEFLERKQRVSVIRAAKRLCARSPNWTWRTSEGLGSTLVFYNRHDVLSFGMAELKSERLYGHYRSRDERIPAHWVTDEAALRARLAPGGREHYLVVEGGPWWRCVRRSIAERDGDHEQVARMTAEASAAKEKLLLGVQQALSRL